MWLTAPVTYAAHALLGKTSPEPDSMLSARQTLFDGGQKKSRGTKSSTRGPHTDYCARKGALHGMPC